MQNLVEIERPAWEDEVWCFSLFIARQITDARYWYSNSVCPSVCLSVRDTLVLYENGLTYRHIFVSPYGSPIILVLPASNIFTKFYGVIPCWGAKYRRAIKISRFSTNKSLYLANDTRYRHSLSSLSPTHPYLSLDGLVGLWTTSPFEKSSRVAHHIHSTRRQHVYICVYICVTAAAQHHSPPDLWTRNGPTQRPKH